MRVLITWGSERGGTEGIALILAEVLRARGYEVIAQPAHVARPEGFDAVIVGGAIYANRWHREARRFVARHVDALRRVPTWLFSSGPLDDSARGDALPPPPQVAAAMQRVGAVGHVTFGGRLAADATGFPARAMARTHAGDWRDPARIRGWATQLADALPTAQPRAAAEPPARGRARWFAHASAGWLLAAIPTAALRQAASTSTALAAHAVLAPAVFLAIAWHYFRPGARDPAPTAVGFGVLAALLDLALLRDHPVLGVALPAALVALVTLAIGALRSTMPWPRAPRGGSRTAHPA